MEIPIETRQIKKHYGSLHAVDGINMVINPGEIYGLLGPNGAGKTTLIRLLVGLIRPTAGQALVLGYNMPNKAALSQVGYMTQAGALYGDLTVRENINFFAAMCGTVNRKRIEEVLDLVELSKRADSLVRNLSGGMKQRASLAVALAHNPRLLLLDEPTVGVDPQLRAVFWSYFRHLADEGITLLISSHVMDEAERCDRLGLLRQGRLLSEGSSSELRSQAGTVTLEEAFLHFAQGGN